MAWSAAIMTPMWNVVERPDQMQGYCWPQDISFMTFWWSIPLNNLIYYPNLNFCFQRAIPHLGKITARISTHSAGILILVSYIRFLSNLYVHWFAFCILYQEGRLLTMSFLLIVLSIYAMLYGIAKHRNHHVKDAKVTYCPVKLKPK